MVLLWSVAIYGGLYESRRIGNIEDYEDLFEYKTDEEVKQERKARQKLDDEYLLSDNILKVLKWPIGCNKTQPYLVSMRRLHLTKLLQKEIEKVNKIKIIYGQFNDIQL
jgi:hypothetical protein